MPGWRKLACTLNCVNQLQIKDLRHAAELNRLERDHRQERPARNRSGRAVVCLRRLFQVGGERDNLSALLYGHPLHFRFEPRRNVELNHLCHNHPPIHRSSPGFFHHHRARCSAHCVIRCGRRLEESGSILVAGPQLFSGASVSCPIATTVMEIARSAGELIACQLQPVKIAENRHSN
jgi:hypothetical protein